MKKILLFSFLVLSPVSTALAEMDVFETVRGTATVYNVILDSVTAVNMDSGRLLKGRKAVEIWNDDASNDAFCNFKTTVSSVTTSANLGRRIETRQPLYWAISDTMIPYCVSTSSAIRVVYTQFY